MRYIDRLLTRRASERDLFRYLEMAGASGRPHHEQNLLSHLRGTYGLLKHWGCGEDVCRAGLFHSAYGTPIYRDQTIPLSQRTEICALIGKQAERLAYLYSVWDRRADAPRFAIMDGSQEAPTPQEWADLVTIECANLIDQEAPIGHIRRFMRDMRDAGFESPTGAHQAIEGTTDGLI